MKAIEIKARVDYRVKPLMAPGVYVKYKRAEFKIQDYDFMDSDGMYHFMVSDREEPILVSLADVGKFLSELKRVDGVEIPPLDKDATQIAPPKKAKKKTLADLDEEEEADELPEIEHITEMGPSVPVVNKQFVHVKSMVDVYVTREYGIFSILQGNRSLNKLKIKRIREEIAAGTNLLQYCPIIVMEYQGKLKVIDGQHRLEVAKQIQSNVWYVVLKNEISLYEIAKMNSNTEKWTAKDFINCYAHTGNASYVTLRKFIAAYGYPVSVSLQLLASGLKVNDSGGDVITLFQQGKFVVRKEQEAISIAQNIEKFKCFPAYKSRPFIVAICKIMTVGKIEVDEVAAAVAKHTDEVGQHSNWKDYLAALERVVNIGKSKRRVIY
jgi:hypothetical protein